MQLKLPRPANRISVFSWVGDSISRDARVSAASVDRITLFEVLMQPEGEEVQEPRRGT